MQSPPSQKGPLVKNPGLPIRDIPVNPPSVVKTTNQMGYMDAVTNEFLQRFLDFAPQAPGHLMDLGCAWGYTIEQLLAINKKHPFLGKQRKIFAIDMAKEHLNHVSKKMPRKYVETCKMRFPYQDSQKVRDVFSPNSFGAVYAGLIFPYLNGEELVQGLRLLCKVTAPGGRVYMSVHTPFDTREMSKDYRRRKKDSSIAFPGWYPDGFERKKYVPAMARNQVPDFIHVFDKEMLSRYLEDAGFHMVKCVRFPRGRMRMLILGAVAEKKVK